MTIERCGYAEVVLVGFGAAHFGSVAVQDNLTGFADCFVTVVWIKLETDAVGELFAYIQTDTDTPTFGAFADIAGSTHLGRHHFGFAAQICICIRQGGQGSSIPQILADFAMDFQSKVFMLGNAVFFLIADGGFAFRVAGKDFVFALAVRLGNIGYRNGGYGCK